MNIIIELVIAAVVFCLIELFFNVAFKEHKKNIYKEIKSDEAKFSNYNTRKWTDIIDNEVWNHVIDSALEKRRLVDSGLYSEREFSELCHLLPAFKLEACLTN